MEATLPETVELPFGSDDWRRVTYHKTVTLNPFIPEDVRVRGFRENAKQRAFLLATDVEEVFYGGSAGGGKTVATLAAAVQYVDVPGYSALLLRENFGDLSKPGAWIDLSRQWWHDKANFNERDRCWRFPSGATITFGYLDSDKAVYQYDSASFHFVAIDELTQHTEWRYRFMFGRIRRPKTGILSKIPLRMRSTSNPGNAGHEWVKKRFVDPKTREKGAVFIPATLDDNKGNLDVEEYRSKQLSKLDPITRAQREKGDWDAYEGGRFKAEWLTNTWKKDDHFSPEICTLTGWNQEQMKFIEIERFNWKTAATFQTCDPSASASTAADFFVLSTWKVTPKANLVWWDCERLKLEIDQQVRVAQASYRKHNPQFIGVEEVLNQRALAQLLRKSLNPMMVVRKLDPLGRDKLSRAVGFINLAATGRLFLPERHGTFPIEDVKGELVRFTGLNDEESSDAVDTGSYACEMLPQVRAGGVTPAGRAPFRHSVRSRSHLDGLR